MKKSPKALSDNASAALAKALLLWYDPAKREMPWRGEKDPYAVWISEIMLQQTRVETVRTYFVRFLDRFPTVNSLAKAPLQDVLKCWEGLGYYSRARNLQKAAQQVVAAGGTFPSTVEDWSQLPGIGPYTAASISSICQGIYAPVVDGNVIRVFSRYLEWEEDFRKVPKRELLAEWLQPAIEASKHPGDFNQAMMDLGATCCTPKSPTCEVCPLAKNCKAKKNGTWEKYPWKPPKKRIPVRQQCAFLISKPNGDIFLVRRPTDGLLGGLWELPNADEAPGETGNPPAKTFEQILGVAPQSMRYWKTLTHVFTHFKLLFRVFLCQVEKDPDEDQSVRAFYQPTDLPLTTVTRKAIKQLNAETAQPTLR